MYVIYNIYTYILWHYLNMQLKKILVRISTILVEERYDMLLVGDLP